MSDRPDSNVSCPHCGRNFCDHDRERVTHDNGTYSYDYICPTQQGLDLLDGGLA